MRNLISALILPLAIVLAGAGSAGATRPIAGYDFPDVCRNIHGKQTILDIHAGLVVFTHADKGLCRPGHHPHR